MKKLFLLLTILIGISSSVIGQIKNNSSSVIAQIKNNPCYTKALNISTGFNPIANSRINVGDSDNMWSLISVPSSSTSTTVPRPAFVVSYAYATPTSPDSRWLSGENTSSWGTNNPTAPYVFERCFCVEKDDKYQINISDFRADDRGVVTLTGSGGPALNLINQPGTSTAPNFKIGNTYNNTHFLTAGSYCIRVELYNISSVAMAFLLEGTISSASNMANLNTDVCCKKVGSILGRKIIDKNCNGKKDNDDTYLQGVVFTLKNSTGATVATSTSDATGIYSFHQIPAGSYTVVETTPAGYTPYNSLASKPVTVTPLTVSYVDFFNCPNGSQSDCKVDCCIPNALESADWLRKQFTLEIVDGVARTYRLKFTPQPTFINLINSYQNAVNAELALLGCQPATFSPKFELRNSAGIAIDAFATLSPTGEFSEILQPNQQYTISMKMYWVGNQSLKECGFESKFNFGWFESSLKVITSSGIRELPIDIKQKAIKLLN